jgi:hypothetical protein
MTPIEAIVVFGVPEREVDALIEDITCTAAVPARWVVFGTDMNLMGALVHHWKHQTNIVPVLVPGTDESVLEMALFLLEHEGIERESVVWLHGAAAVTEPPPGVRAEFRVSRNAIDLDDQQWLKRLLETVECQ